MTKYRTCQQSIIARICTALLADKNNLLSNAVYITPIIVVIVMNNALMNTVNHSEQCTGIALDRNERPRNCRELPW